MSVLTYLADIDEKIEKAEALRSKLADQQRYYQNLVAEIRHKQNLATSAFHETGYAMPRKPWIALGESLVEAQKSYTACSSAIGPHKAEIARLNRRRDAIILGVQAAFVEEARQIMQPSDFKLIMARAEKLAAKAQDKKKAPQPEGQSA